MRVVRVLFSCLSIAVIVGCQQAQPPAAKESAPPAALSPQPYGTLLEVMRGIPFPSSNVIFDTQMVDPGKQERPEGAGKTGKGATSTYSGVYSGWLAVENNAVAVAETANLVMIPGRLCGNGKPVPVDKEDFKKWAQGLAEAGKTAYKAAKEKNLEAMVEVSGTVSDACAACHDRYRDVPDGKERCI